jgi:hypothetical protein
MNLGIYTNSLAVSDETEMIINNLNEGVEDNLLSAASIFFDTVGFNPLPMKCGCFNAADIWNFPGTLMTSSMSSLFRSLKVVNKASIIYYYGWEENPPILSLIGISQQKRVRVVCKDEEAKKEFFRLTGVESNGVINNFNIKEIVKLVKS